MKSWRILCMVAVLLLMPASRTHADFLGYTSDLIDTSAPGAAANHRITFTTVSGIPGGGTISLTFQPGFVFPLALSSSDVAISTIVGTTSAYRASGAISNSTQDGIAVDTTNGIITITLASSTGITGNTQVAIQIGTNAPTGLYQILNPLAPQSYRIDIATKDMSGSRIDHNSAMIAVVLPVNVIGSIPNIAPVISNGYPSGTIEAGNSTVELSVTTDKKATCRFSTTPGTPYASMTNQFSPSLGLVFSYIVSGLQNGTSYSYYVRCINQTKGANDTDYPITFTLKPTPISNTSVTISGGGTIGSGPFVNGSPTLYLANVVLSGSTAPGSSVTILKDGAQAATAQAAGDGTFTATIPSLERGTYTFLLYSTDTQGHVTNSYTTTFALNPATNSNVSGIILSPSIALSSNAVGIGETFHVYGQSIPGSRIEADIYPTTASNNTPIQALFATTTGAGRWDITVPGLTTADSYAIKAHTTFQSSQSDDSKTAYVGVGGKPIPKGAIPGDLNGDGKVNLVDFSILLTGWGTASAQTDINADGTTNLADFSIMLFNWTG